MSDVPPPWERQIRALRREHLRDARLYADRFHLIDSLGPAKADVVVELGVTVGQFSRALITRYDPQRVYGIDTFALHGLATLRGRPAREIFGARTHREYYLEALAEFSDRVVALEGDGAQQLETLADASADVIYIDGSHHYADVVRDCAVSVRKIKPGGLLIFNDYILWSHREDMWYGVVPVVNELVIQRGAQVVGFALHRDMYADIAFQL